jgi:hypothetical protein
VRLQEGKWSLLPVSEDEAFNLACEARAEGIEGIEKVRRKFKKAVKALQLPLYIVNQ